MKVQFECIPCMVRQTIRTARISNVPDKLQREVVNEVMAYLQKADFSMSPPELGKYIYAIIRERTGVADPYHAIKQRYDQAVLTLYDELKRRVYLNEDPVRLAVIMAASGNVIDFGVNEEVDQVQSIIDQAQHSDLFIDDYVPFMDELTRAKHILYLADNAGEIVFDKLLIEVLKRFYPECDHQFTVVVRGAPIINDATREDAQLVGMESVARVIDNGDDAPATVLHHVSDEMRAYYDSADLIISKGQGNFETLHNEDKHIYFMFKVKCQVISGEVNVPEGQLVLKRGEKASPLERG